jgi:mannose/fructose/N-acetylgalactosamine-specific phosphotransferase system component IIB
MIVFARIDDRVIHGQTMVTWLAEYPCDGIVIVDDELAGNSVMAEIYKCAVPPSIKVHVFDLDTAVRRMSEVEVSQKKYILVFKTVLTFEKMVESCKLPITQVNVGPSSKRPDTVEIVPTISLDVKEIEAYKNIAKAGIKIYFQIIPSVKKVWWGDDQVQKKIV